MELAWRHERLTAREVLDALHPRDITLSTVQSTLERLTRKNLLTRQKQRRAFEYVTKLDRTALITLLMNDLSQDLATGRIEPLLSGFLNLVDELEPDKARAMLDTLRAHLEVK